MRTKHWFSFGEGPTEPRAFGDSLLGWQSPRTKLLFPLPGFMHSAETKLCD